MPFSPSSSTPKTSIPISKKRCSGWPGASWGSSWTEKPKAHTEVVRHARKSTFPKLNWPFVVPRSVPGGYWQQVAASSATWVRTWLVHLQPKTVWEKPYSLYGQLWERMRDMELPSSFTNTQENCPKYQPIQSCTLQTQLVCWTQNSKGRLFLNTHPQ